MWKRSVIIGKIQAVFVVKKGKKETVFSHLWQKFFQIFSEIEKCPLFIASLAGKKNQLARKKALISQPILTKNSRKSFLFMQDCKTFLLLENRKENCQKENNGKMKRRTFKLSRSCNFLCPRSIIERDLGRDPKISLTLQGEEKRRRKDCLHIF